MNRTAIRTLFRWIMAVFFIGAGVNHFASPDFYRGMIPSYIPWHSQLVAVTGVAEILGGIGVLAPRTRTPAGMGLIVLLVAVLPVHIEMVLRGFRSIPMWLLWLRLPFQGILMFWVYWCCRQPRAEGSDHG